ncbi:MAG: hypothetical protein JWM45_757, partial [Pseudonocardiales bacterium]|nr:hypothetical protein [Pseudonocardiales bacterium]
MAIVTRRLMSGVDVGRQIDYGPLARPSSTRQSPLSDAPVVR